MRLGLLTIILMGAMTCLAQNTHEAMPSGVVLADSAGRGRIQADSAVVADTMSYTIDSLGIKRDRNGRIIPTKWVEPEKEKKYFLTGFAFGGDLVGPVMKAAGSTWSQLEIMGRISLREKVFPIFEFGVGTSTRVGNTTSNRFHTSAPYFRGGLDINCNKKRRSNRFMVGFRIGYSSFSYDYSNPDQADPVWKEPVPLDIKDLSGSAAWGEAVLGFEAKIWSFIRIGWNGRYKFLFTKKHYEYGEPWYIPGYGINGSNCWGGVANIIFEFGRSMKKGR